MAELAKKHFQTAMDAIDRIESAPSADAVAGIVKSAVAVFGLEHFCCLTPRSSRYPTFEDCMLMNRWPSGWFEMYRRSDFHRHDPIIRHTRTQLRPTAWSEAPVSNDPIARTIMSVAAVDFGMRAGISVPIYGINSYQAGVSFAGLEIDESKDARSAIELIAIYSFNRCNNFRAAATPAPGRLLTARQREILTWVANGKTAWDTGQILGVTPDNINKVVITAINKLQASNRTHAVVEAIRRREIDI
ncbi:LuxR family transcriptional regulator [soil metagenome]